MLALVNPSGLVLVTLIAVIAISTVPNFGTVSSYTFTFGNRSHRSAVIQRTTFGSHRGHRHGQSKKREPQHSRQKQAQEGHEDHEGQGGQGGPRSQDVDGGTKTPSLMAGIRQGYQQRIAADPSFGVKSITEVILAAATQFTAEWNRRGASRLLPEIDFVLPAVLCAIFGKYYRYEHDTHSCVARALRCIILPAVRLPVLGLLIAVRCNYLSRMADVVVVVEVRACLLRDSALDFRKWSKGDPVRYDYTWDTMPCTFSLSRLSHSGDSTQSHVKLLN
mmetsp:Transcript_1566/g.4270  ORF Transcript_1566/g.4270 Transcript_1566/m.4270 type:complete len:277 (+) Transcript_1566:161-991(+)